MPLRPLLEMLIDFVAERGKADVSSTITFEEGI